jgi:hypothetical protein
MRACFGEAGVRCQYLRIGALPQHYQTSSEHNQEGSLDFNVHARGSFPWRKKMLFRARLRGDSPGIPVKSFIVDV